MSRKEKQFWLDCVILLILAMSAIAMLGEVSRQAWAGKLDHYPGIAASVTEQRARALLAEMTLPEKVGQMFYARNPDNSGRSVEKYAPGGVLLHTKGLTERDLRIIAEGFSTEMFVTVDKPLGDTQVPVFSRNIGDLQVITDVRRSYVQAVREGADVLVAADYERGIGQVLRAVECGALTQARIDESVLKILMVKIEQGMLQ